MSQLIHLKQRIQTVEMIHKITNAMRITAMSTHAKMNHQLAFLKHYEQELTMLFRTVHAAQKKIISEDEQKVVKKALIIVGSDKGLCGNFNTALLHFFKNHQHLDATTTLIVVGKKIADLLLQAGFKPQETIDHVSLSALHTIAEKLFRMIEPYTHVTFFFTESKSFFIQRPTELVLLPATPNDDHARQEEDDRYIWPEDPAILLEHLKAEFLRFSIQHILFDSMYAEQSARFKSMDSATRNAESILEEMKIQYAKLRQAKITKELTELSGHY